MTAPVVLLVALLIVLAGFMMWALTTSEPAGMTSAEYWLRKSQREDARKEHWRK